MTKKTKLMTDAELDYLLLHPLDGIEKEMDEQEKKIKEFELPPLEDELPPLEELTDWTNEESE